jgi:hypothetical protein
MKKNIVHIVLKDGVIWDAYSEGDVDMIVYDLDTDDALEREDIEEQVRELEARSEAGELDRI